MTTGDGENRSLERRFIQLYFWIYWLQCINGTYLNLYLKKVSGFSGTEIGILSGVFSAAGVVLSPLIGIKFDSSRRRPGFLATLAVLAGVSFCLYAAPVPWYTFFPLAVMFACGWLPIVPLTDSIASSERVSGASRHGYGGYRRWGTVGFALAGGLTGQLTGAVGLWAVFPAYAACAFVVAWLARGIPEHVTGHVPKDHKAAVASRIPDPSAVLQLLKLPNFRMFLAVILLSSVGAGACYTFRSIYLSSIGLSDRAIGMLWLLIVPGEVFCFTMAARWQKRWGTGPLVTFGLVIAGIRWVLLSFVNVPVLYLVEILHGIGFAVYYPAAVGFVQRETPPHLRGTAQILFFSTAAGIGTAIGAAAAGRIYDLVGMREVLWFGGGLQIIGGVLQSVLVRHHPSTPGSDAGR
jgi:PPP family 3-phenylpropionic acid transporter